MNNADEPAMAMPENEFNSLYYGLSKREQFCLQMGVPKTGDPELDDIINEGNKIKLAGLAFQAIIIGNQADINSLGKGAAIDAAESADALLAELGK